MIEIRPAVPADAVRWTEMRTALWPEQSSAGHAAEIAAYFAGTERAVADPEAVLVAEAPGRGVIGFAELTLRSHAESCTTSPVGFLEGWYVAPEYRGRGVGRALMAAAEAWARAQGCREFASDTELENMASVAAHRALGFEEVAVIRCFRKSLD